ncbi:type IV toxin-antitoxin system AbiEi family antitoxin domain-containing protein [Limnohabitans sp.]|uniref:type IV toxin-antitoxin system AbiEi family antitoxin domain-containing protein n=1 Tax=Limnohabitans sp. TaxID=1907725 RepID=UPI0038B85D69
MHSITQHPAPTLAKKQGFVRARELALVGAAGGTLQQLLETGSLVKVERGVYALAGRKPTELDDLGPIAI